MSLKEVIMSYQDVMRQFKKNVQLTKAKDDLMWNPNAGLADVTKALSQDLAEMQRTLNTISQILSRIEAKSR